jgi:hypothetical protein
MQTMATAALSKLARNIEIADQLRAWRHSGFEPQDLPEPFGTTVRAIDRILQAQNTPALHCGDWAVWRYGYPRRISDDLDIILPEASAAEFVRVACATGFVDVTAGRCARKLVHCNTQVQVDVLPGRKFSAVATEGLRLQFIDLPTLVVMKLAADRSCDRSDVVELILANPEQIRNLRARAADLGHEYTVLFDRLAASAAAQRDS